MQRNRSRFGRTRFCRPIEPGAKIGGLICPTHGIHAASKSVAARLARNLEPVLISRAGNGATSGLGACLEEGPGGL
jgi:hypothetical protein